MGRFPPPPTRAGWTHRDGTMSVRLLGGVEVCGQEICQEPDENLFYFKTKSVFHQWDCFPLTVSSSSGDRATFKAAPVRGGGGRRRK